MKISSSTQTFLREMEKIIQFCVSEINRSGRENCLSIYNRLDTSDRKLFAFKHRKFKEKEVLIEILMIHWIDEEIRALFQIEEEEFVAKHVSLECRDLFTEFIYNKEYLLNYIILTHRYWKNCQEFFGTLCATEFTLYPYLKKVRDFKYENNPVNHSRHRGYRDKGSLGSSFIGHKEWIKDFSNLEQEKERIRREGIYSDTTELIKGFIQ